jgi:hypothetical protein
MNTKLLMSLSAAFMAILGLAATFMPHETLVRHGARADGFAVFLVQLVGALYLGFAMLNWMGRASLIGGIYGRPVALGNLVHFAVVAITLVKMMVSGSISHSIIIASVIYLALAAWFGLVVFTHPAQNILTTGD